LQLSEALVEVGKLDLQALRKLRSCELAELLGAAKRLLKVLAAADELQLVISENRKAHVASFENQQERVANVLI
jgi:hypothetical protein